MFEVKVPSGTFESLKPTYCSQRSVSLGMVTSAMENFEEIQKQLLWKMHGTVFVSLLHDSISLPSLLPSLQPTPRCDDDLLAGRRMEQSFALNCLLIFSNDQDIPIVKYSTHVC